MKGPIKLYHEPELRNPRLVMGWPDEGYVGVTVVDYLKDKLGAEEFGEIESYDFSLTPRILVRDSVMEALEFPKNEFYYWRNPAGENDLIIFRGSPPTLKAYQLVNLILDVAQKLGVKRIYPVGGLYSGITHTQKPKVLAAVSQPELKEYLRDFDVQAGINYYGPPNMNGLSLGIAQMRGMEVVLTVAEIPFYIASLPYPMDKYPKSSQSLLEVITQMLNLEIDLSEMEQLVKLTEAKMGNLYDELYQKATKEADETIHPTEAMGEAEGGIPELVRQRIEELFKQAQKDRAKALELQRELQRLGLFEEYQDRFFDLFRKED